ncbi:MAG TPA: phosphatase PAP2 family protein [Elusimicrobiales bacterium]|nr:phosphatase PAP2 family protein [Elusimicrobiales bacterium]
MNRITALTAALLLAFLKLPPPAGAAGTGLQKDTDYPRLTALPGNVFSDIKIYGKETFRKENIKPALGIAAATGILIYYDQKIIDEMQRFGRKLGLGNEDRTTPYIKAGGLSLFRGPADTGSTLYFLGDGWVHSSILAGFYAYGYIADSPRAVRTGYALMEGLGTTAVIGQVLKRSTGRQSPFVATSDRGIWHVFPNQSDYNKHVAFYDAFPSGHLMTAMMTVTVISTNYPEYKAIKPVGYTLMSLLAFQMMNNGVHWASDYPLALSIGYSMGKIAARRSQGEFGGGKGKDSALILPDIGPDRAGIIAMKRI